MVCKASIKEVNVRAVSLLPAAQSRDLRAVWVTLAKGRSQDATSGSGHRGIEGRQCVTLSSALLPAIEERKEQIF